MGVILIFELLLDLIVLIAFLWIKATMDIFLEIVSTIGIVLMFADKNSFYIGKKVNR